MPPIQMLRSSSLRFLNCCCLGQSSSSQYPNTCLVRGKSNFLVAHRGLRRRALVRKLRCYGFSNHSIGIGVKEAEQSDKITDDSIVDANLSNGFEKQLEDFFVQIKNMLKMGDKAGAADLLLANYEATKEQIDVGNKGVEQAATLDVVALGYLAAGELKFVEHLLTMLMEIVGGLSDDNPPLDSILIHMGSMYTIMGKLEEAMLVYSRAQRILEHLFGKKSPFLVVPLLGKGKVFKLMGKFKNSIDVYKETVNILEVSRGPENEDLVVPLSALGNILIDRGRAIEAEPYFERIVSIYEKAYGEADGKAGMARCFLARCLRAKGSIQQALLEYQNGLQIVKDSKYMAFDDDVLQKMRVELADLLHVAGRIQEGRKMLEESLRVAEISKGSGHPSLVTPLLNLSTSYSRSNNYVEAERLVRVALELISKNMDSMDQDITVPMLQLAIILYHQGKDEEAENIALQVLHNREEAFGKYSLPVGEALDCLTSIQIRLGKGDEEILEQLKRILEIQEKGLGYENKYVLGTLKKIIFFLEKMGRKVEKLPFERRLSSIRSKYKRTIPIQKAYPRKINNIVEKKQSG